MIVLNGISSSGKSTIARHLQLMLDDTYLTFGVDTLLAAMPAASALHDSDLIEFDPGGGVSLGAAFRTLEAGWYEDLAAMARAGLGLVVDEVFLGGRRVAGEVGRRLRRSGRALGGRDM